ncbi:MAG: alpha/beta fold hydrolase, partial [Myxococcaceae bacterium]
MSLHNPWILPLLFLAVALVVWGWSLAVLWFYRLKGPQPEVLQVRCADGWELSVYFRPAPVRRFEEPVLLCHGLAANRFNFEFDPPYSLAHVLAEAGFDCFTVEWRGTGGSRKPPKGRRWQYTADELITLDTPAVIEAALQR